MTTPTAKFRRAKETTFLICDEIIFDEFSPYALKVYGQLRKLVSYQKECDDAEITIKNLAKASGISERKTYDVLNELEHVHYIIQRTNVYHYRYGQVNSFTVGQTYGMFKPVQESITPAPHAEGVDNYGQNLTTPALYAVGTAPDAVGTAPNADLYIEQESSQEVSKKKQNKESVKPHVFVFSCKEDVKTHVENTIAKRGVEVEEEIINQIAWYASHSIGNDFELKKKVNMGLKKVREGKWNTPQGYNGITSQSIRDKEEQQAREKQEQYRQEAQAFQSITGAVSKGEGLKSFSDMFQKLKAEVNG